MKITLEFEHPHELTALLVELASVIEQPEPCCDVHEPMTPAEMMGALRPPTKEECDRYNQNAYVPRYASNPDEDLG